MLPGGPTSTLARTLTLTLTDPSRWANLNRRGDSNTLHEHLDPDWALSGVAYLSAGGDPSCALRFVSPWAVAEGSGAPALPAAGAVPEACCFLSSSSQRPCSISSNHIVTSRWWVVVRECE